MGGAHVTGGGFGALLGVTIVTLLNRYAGTHLSDQDSVLIGGAALASGAGIGHVIATEGIVPSIKRVIFGPVSKSPGSSEAVHDASSDPIGTAPGDQGSAQTSTLSA